jgi:Peptidase family M28
MRHISLSLALAAALGLTALTALGPHRAAAQPAAKVKALKGGPTAAATFGNADSITEQEMKIHLYFLASDQLEGRNFPSRGYDTAALYIASHLAQWGLKPGGSATGTNGPLQPYFMPIELQARQIVPEESKLSLADSPAGTGRGNRSESNTTTFEYGKDWVSGQPGGFAGGRGAPVEAIDAAPANLVFAGNGYVINKTNTNPYANLDVKGKFIVVAGLPPEIAAQNGGGRGRGGNAPNPLGEACTDFLTPEQYAAKNGALGVVTIANFQQLNSMANPNAGGRGGRGAGLNGPNYQVVKFRQTSTCPSAPSITAGLDLTNALFQGEKLSPSQVFYATGSNPKLESFELSANKKLGLHMAVKSEAGHGENVIGILEGSDPVLKNEYVIMSAHLDHVGMAAPLPNGHNVNNGADDDGSGSTALLAIAHSYVEGAAKGIRPRRSILFLWNGGEEKGLLGSQYFAQFPPIDLTKVVANLNMDMIGRTKNEKSSDPNTTHVLVKPGEVLLIGPNISSDDLEQVIESVNNRYQKLTFNHFYDVTAPDATHDNLGPQPRGQRVFYRSDHYNFAKMGIPIAFFTTGLHEDYHRATDTPEKIDYKAMVQISKTVSAVGWDLANQNGRPKLNSKLPDDLVKDMKTVQTQGWGKLTPVLAPLPGEPY